MADYGWILPKVYSRLFDMSVMLGPHFQYHAALLSSSLLRRPLGLINRSSR